MSAKSKSKTPSAPAVDRAALCSGCVAKAKDLEARKKWLQSEALRYYGYAQQQMETVKRCIERGEWGMALDTLARVRNDNQSSAGYLQGLHILTAPQYGPNDQAHSQKGLDTARNQP